MSYRVFYLSGLFLLTSLSSLFAQVSDPALWDSFIYNSTKNVEVRDTFRFQSFEGELTDNWKYNNKDASLFNATSDNINKQGGNFSLKLPANASVEFEAHDISKYREVMTLFGFAARNIPKGTKVEVTAFKPDKIYPITVFEAPINDYCLSYRDIAHNGDPDKKTKVNPFMMLNAYSLKIQSPEMPTDAYICIDSVLAYGYIAGYSLFSGKGNWRDTALWTHLPAERARKALIKGDIVVNDMITCKEASVSDGSIHIKKGNRLALNRLFLHETDAFFTSEGDVEIDKNITVYRTLPGKGEWYFISFPFDVYKEGIDPAFTLQDDTPNKGGNYLYVLDYNGNKRQENNSQTGNWDVVSPSELNGRPVFEKNKGYLIALDAKAATRTLSFSSMDKIPTTFGKEATLNISVSPSASGDTEDSGWYLCGNPFAAPLSLSQFPKTPDLDGYIYVYNGSTYTAYAIGSNYKLPPFSAFFVKAKTASNIQLTKTFGTDKEILLPFSFPVQLSATDPNTQNVISTHTADAAYSLVSGNRLVVKNLPEQTKLYIYDIKGALVMKQNISPGTSEVPLPLTNGFYIIHIVSPAYRAQHKCVINNN